MKILAWLYVALYAFWAVMFWGWFFEGPMAVLAAIFLLPISIVGAWMVTWGFGWVIRNILFAIAVYYLVKQEGK